MCGLFDPFTFDTYEPTEGYFCGRFTLVDPKRPVVIQWPAAKWSPLSWCSERMNDTFSNRFATCGIRALVKTPGVFVLHTPNGPRNSAGASGLGSKVSSWLGPPSSQMRMTDLSFAALPLPFAFAWACARKRSGRARP